MTWQVSDEDIGQESPYVHWWWQNEDEERVDLFANPAQYAKGSKYFAKHAKYTDGNEIFDDIPNQFAPVPKHAASTFDELEPWKESQIINRLPKDLPPETVITAVVDTGIALGHRRFRDKYGRTRVVAAWQQTASFGHQDYIPFGEELYQDEINKALRDFSHDLTYTGKLDEDGFNRQLKLVEPHEDLGHRDLDYRAAHGTHVMDLAAGMDPDLHDAEALRSNPLIVVNLPPQSLHGSAGNFLSFWALAAVKRILFVADTLNKANRGGGAPEGGFPVVINFSYGMQAGSKDGESSWEKALNGIVYERRSKGKSPVRLVMPAGNDNSERCHARTLMGGKSSWTRIKDNGQKGKTYRLTKRFNVPWRIMPEDHTTNFLEIWLNALRTKKDTKPKTADPKNLRIFVTPPGMAASEVPRLKKGQYANLVGDDGLFARIYCRDDSSKSLGYVVCVAPTSRLGKGKSVAPAGLWHVELYYKGEAVNAAMYVQSDQAGVRHSRNGRASYLDHEEYDAFLPNGRPRDSYDYLTSNHTDRWKDFGPVQIKGTQNALATTEDVVAIGGYRLSDGAPTIYSSSADGNSKRNGKGREILDASYPSEVSPSLHGLLASGSNDGSYVSFRGTSMATALATRDIVKALQKARGNRDAIGTIDWVRNRAAEYTNSPERPNHYKRVRLLKAGVGQIQLPDSPDLRDHNRL